ncbi:MAG: DNA polymerase III subunit delta [Bacteroidaceae bacterium]|nr:DNA polymerase III subunit delta [Bacteroidaceae bacterium]
MAGEVSFKQIMTGLKKGTYSPVYYLMGDEPYFIDRISDYIEQNAIPEDERDFNQIVVYALDTSMQNVLERARSYPMMGQRQVIIVKEAQHLSGDTELLSAYLTMPQPSTVLVFCHRNGTLDKRKKVAGDIARAGVLFTSKKLGDSQVLQFVDEYVSEKGLTISSKGCSMIAESVGADLCRITGELDKLAVSMARSGDKEITPELIERLVGISKDYNVFEFRDAIINKNIFKANQIALYYEKNSKTYPIQMVSAVLFQYFANLMLAYYAPDRTEQGIAAQLGLKSTWGVRDYLTGMRNYSAMNVLGIISELRYTDARSKGVEATGNSTEGLLRELVFKILHQ